MKLLCLLGFHDFEDMGLAQFGRGRLWRCKKCKKRRLEKLSVEKLQMELDDEVEEIKERPKPEPKKAPATVWLQVAACPKCRRPFFWTTQRCPDCG